MKRNIFAIITLIALIGSFPLYAQNDVKIKRMKYVHRACIEQISSNKARSNSRESLRMKSMDIDSSMNRVLSRSGRIDIIPVPYENRLPDSDVQIAFLKAADIWSSYLSNTNPIRIIFKMEPMPEDINAECYVNYVQTSADECIPTSLKWANSMTHRTSSNLEDYDAEVILNSTKTWDTTTVFDRRGDGGYNLTTTMMRCIAQTMGFGTTIMYDLGGVDMDHGNKFGRLYGDDVLSTFEKMIYKPSGIKLENLDINSERFADFVQPESEKGVYVIYTKENYMLYTPKRFQETKSLSYLNNPGSLMWYDFQPADKFFRVDDATLDILRRIGWSKLSATPSVAPLEISLKKVNGTYEETVHACAYDMLYLMINDSQLGQTSNYRHGLYVIEKNTGRRISVDGKEATEPRNAKSRRFQIQAPSDYYINDMGELKLELQYDCDINGKPIETQVYRLALDAKPIIRSVTDRVVDTLGNGKVNLKCKVNYDGAIPDKSTRYYVQIKRHGANEYSVQTPDIDSVGNISIVNLDATTMSDPTELKIIVKTEIGQSQPFVWNFISTAPDFNPSTAITGPVPLHYYYSIYEVNGNKVAEGNAEVLDEMRSRLKPGFYILHKYGSDGTVEKQMIKIE